MFFQGCITDCCLYLCQILSDSIFWENLFTGKIYVLPCSSLFGKFCVISKAFLQTSSKSNRFIHGSRHLVFTILKLEPSVSIISGLRSNFWEAQNGRSVMNLVYFGCSAMVTTRLKILDYRSLKAHKMHSTGSSTLPNYPKLKVEFCIVFEWTFLIIHVA